MPIVLQLAKLKSQERRTSSLTAATIPTIAILAQAALALVVEFAHRDLVALAHWGLIHATAVAMICFFRDSESGEHEERHEGGDGGKELHGECVDVGADASCERMLEGGEMFDVGLLMGKERFRDLGRQHVFILRTSWALGVCLFVSV